MHGDPLAPTGTEEAGGQNVYVREVARALVARGIPVDVFTRGREVTSPEVEEDQGVRVIRIPAGPSGFIPRTELFNHLPEFARNVASWAVREGARYDVIHSNYWLSGWVGMQLADVWGCPQVHTHHSLGAVKYGLDGGIPRAGRVRIETEEALLRAADRIVATSPQEVESLARLYRHRARTTIIPCGVGSCFRPRPRVWCREALGLPTAGDVVAYVGRFDPAKGIDTFIRSIELLPERHRPRLVLAGGFDPNAGDAREHQRIRGLVAAAGLTERTTFLGRMDHERLATAYGAADMVVVPSHYESFGLVAIEAMGCGLPVVASEVGGLRYTVVHRETGLLVPARDDQAFSSAIASLLDDVALRQRMGDAGARLVQRMFVWEAVAERLERLYREVAQPAVRDALAWA